MREYTFAVEIELLEEGGYLATCPSIPGCRAEGKSIGEALDNLRDVARVLYELNVEQGLVFVPEYPDAKLESIGWNVKIPLREHAA
jgi:predicted RNase H-like HicB family nuclease